MSRIVLAFTVFAVCAAVQPPEVSAQAPNFSGTWVLDAAASRIAPEAGLGVLGAVGTPERLHVTHAANGDLTLQSEWNTSEARIYRPDRETVIPVGPDDTMRIVARWDGATLIAEGRRETAGGGSTILGVRRAISLSADSGVLTIDATTTRSAGSATSTMIYTRLTDLGPCEQWSEPCEPRQP
jgi:hypothetical protein